MRANCTLTTVTVTLEWNKPANIKAQNYTINITSPHGGTLSIYQYFQTAERRTYTCDLLTGTRYTITVIPSNCRGYALIPATVQLRM